MNTAADFPIPQESTTGYVTARVGSQLFGLPIASVREVFVPGRMTRVPLVSRDIAGVLNLRGRVVTVIDMHARLGVGGERAALPKAVGVDQRGESYALLVDTLGEVLRLRDSCLEATPVNLDSRLARVASGVHRLDDELMVVLDAGRLLELQHEDLAA